jgi:uncharacterized protein (TIGR00725 family)
MSPRRPVIGIIGGGDASEPSLTAARKLGAAVARRGCVVLTGGRPVGVMAAACAGAKEVSDSLTLGILPSDGGSVGPDVDVAVFTGLGDARNVINVLTSDAIVACGVEGPGTASAVAHALTAGKPVILLAADESALTFFRQLRGGERILTAESVEDAVRLLQSEIGLRPLPGSSPP